MKASTHILRIQVCRVHLINLITFFFKDLEVRIDFQAFLFAFPYPLISQKNLLPIVYMRMFTA